MGRFEDHVSLYAIVLIDDVRRFRPGLCPVRKMVYRAQRSIGQIPVFVILFFGVAFWHIIFVKERPSPELPAAVESGEAQYLATAR